MSSTTAGRDALEDRAWFWWDGRVLAFYFGVQVLSTCSCAKCLELLRTWLHQVLQFVSSTPPSRFFPDNTGRHGAGLEWCSPA